MEVFPPNQDQNCRDERLRSSRFPWMLRRMEANEGARREQAAAYVRREMANRRMGVRDLAAATGLDVGTVSDFINGRRWPVIKTLGTIEAALEIPAGTLDDIKKGRRSDGTAMNDPENASVDSGVDPDALSGGADTVPTVEERRGDVTGRNVVKVKFAAIGVEVETTYTDGEDRAAVLADIMAAVGITGELDGQGDNDRP